LGDIYASIFKVGSVDLEVLLLNILSEYKPNVSPHAPPVPVVNTHSLSKKDRVKLHVFVDEWYKRQFTDSDTDTSEYLNEQLKTMAQENVVLNISTTSNDDTSFPESIGPVLVTTNTLTVENQRHGQASSHTTAKVTQGAVETKRLAFDRLSPDQSCQTQRSTVE
jgi:hypothetical protein